MRNKSSPCNSHLRVVFLKITAICFNLKFTYSLISCFKKILNTSRPSVCTLKNFHSWIIIFTINLFRNYPCNKQNQHHCTNNSTTHSSQFLPIYLPNPHHCHRNHKQNSRSRKVFSKNHSARKHDSTNNIPKILILFLYILQPLYLVGNDYYQRQLCHLRWLKLKTSNLNPTRCSSLLCTKKHC